jgi:glycosyltransferase involved in cell wall biosynthesis
LSENEVHTTVYCGKASHPKKERIGKYLTVVRLPLFDVSLRAYWFQLQNSSFLARELRKYDVVHAISPQSAAVCIALKNKHMRPVVTTVHDIMLVMMKMFVQAPVREWTLSEVFAYCLEGVTNHMLTKYCVDRSERIIMVGNAGLNYARQVFQNLPLEKVSVIRNGINFEELQECLPVQKPKTGSNRPSVLFFGRLKWHKGITYLVRSMAKLQKKIPNIDLRIAGRGPMFNKLLHLVRALGVGQNVSLLGYVDRKKLISEILNANTICLPSIYEPMANLAMLEAMAFEKAVVAFDLPFAREVIVHNWNGLLARALDENDLAEKIHISLTDQRLGAFLGKNAHAYVQENHNMESVIKDYLKVYENMIR